MNTLENFEQERKTCSNIYEILAHTAVFKPLYHCVFLNLSSENLDNLKIEFPEHKDIFLKTNLAKILEFFKSDENLKKFANEVERFYLEHKEALDRAWTNDSHKNAYSIAIATLRQFKVIENNKNFNKHTSITISQSDDIVKNVQDKFVEIFSWIHPDFEIVWDIKWNLINNSIDVARIFDFFGKNVVEVDRWFIDINTRMPLIIDWCEFRWSWGEFTLPDWNKVIMARLKNNDWHIFNRFMINENTDYSVEWKKVFSIWNNEVLPNWDEVIKVEFENKEFRYVTKENKIYRVLFEGVEWEVIHLWNNEINPEWRESNFAVIIDKNWKKRQLYILKHWIRKPKFIIFWIGFFMWRA